MRIPKLEEYKSYPALPYTAIGGGLGLTAREAYRQGNRVYKRAKRYFQPEVPLPSRRRGSGVILTDGTTAGRTRTLTRTKRKKRKRNKNTFKAVRQDLKKVKKLIPKTSVKTYRQFETQSIAVLTPNECGVWQVNFADKNKLETYVKSLPAVDGTGTVDMSVENVSIKMDQYFKYKMKNAATVAATIEYQWVVCKDDDNESPLKSIREDLVDRGYPTANLDAVRNRDPATVTQSVNPSRMVQQANPANNHYYHIPVFGAQAYKRNWKALGKVQKASVGPGDVIDIVQTRKYNYKQEYKDQENAFNHIKGMDVFLVIKITGDLCHDESNNRLIGYSPFYFDCERSVITKVRWGNPKGLNTVTYTDTLSSNAPLIAKHVDNMASAVEAVSG